MTPPPATAAPTLLLPLIRRRPDWSHLTAREGPPRHRLPVGWPLFAALALFPLWWALGLGSFVFPIFAVPMAWHLVRMGRIQTPPWFGLWGLFVVWSLAGVLVLDLTAPGTLPQSTADGIDAYVLRSLQYVAATVVLLYVGNLSEEQVSRLRIIRWAGVLFIITLAGGFVGLLFPRLEFTSPVEALLPGALASRRGLIQMVHPAVAQIQEVIGTEDARPRAPFEYTNAWGNNLSILLIWFVVGWLVYGAGRRRWGGALLVVAAIVPIVYSLNRGLWAGLVLVTLYVTVRLALAGRMWLLGALATAATALVLVAAVTPLGTVFTERLAAGHSDQVRSSLSSIAIEAGLSSPVLGYGGTRDTIGSSDSIAIGASEECPRCGNRTVGSTGHLWNVLIAQGLVGAFLFVSFFVMTAWHHRRDISPIGLAGQSIVLAQLFYMTAYVGISSTLSLVMLSIGLLWRNQQAREAGLADPPITPLVPPRVPRPAPSWGRPSSTVGDG